MAVIGQGRRGRGDLILGLPGRQADPDAPFSPVIAYGMIETARGYVSVSVREEADALINVEIVPGSGEEVPGREEETRRWTYSLWSPGMPSPATGAGVREVPVDANVTLVLAPAEKRIWVHERTGGTVRLIPITNFYGELMIRRAVRDPHVALRPSLLWERLDGFPDRDLLAAFTGYNALGRHAVLQAPPAAVRRGRIPLVVRQLFTKRH